MVGSLLSGCDVLDLSSGKPVEPPPVPSGLCENGALTLSTFSDLDFPAAAIVSGNEFGIAIAEVDGDVLLGTSGLWRRPVGGFQGWERSGLAGHQVRQLVTVPGMPGTVFAGSGNLAGDPPGSFHRSQDAGHTWVTGGYFYDSSRNLNLPITYLALQPGPQASGMGVLYANLTGYTLVRSTDGGANWQLVDGTLDGVSGSCALLVPSWAPNTMVESCVNSEITGWITSRDLTDHAGSIMPLTFPVSSFIPYSILNQHPPAALASAPTTPGIVWVGMGGGLVQLQGTTVSWVYRADQTFYGPIVIPPWADELGVTTIWFDPCDPEHVVFGGDGSGTNRLFGLYETFDNGQTVLQIPEPFPELGIASIVASARSGVAGKDLVMVAKYGDFWMGNATFRVFLRTHTAIGTVSRALPVR
jgi:hypothetical protein